MPAPAQLQCTLCSLPQAEHVLEFSRNFESDFLEIRLHHEGNGQVESYRYTRLWEALDATWTIEHRLRGTRVVIAERQLLELYERSRPRDYVPELLDPRGRPLAPAALPRSLTPAPAAPDGGMGVLYGMQILVNEFMPSDAVMFMDAQGNPIGTVRGAADEYSRAVIRPDGTVPSVPPPPADVLTPEALRAAFARLEEHRVNAHSIVISPRVHAELSRLYTDPRTGRPDPGAQQRLPRQDPGLKSDDPLEDL